MHNLFVYGTLKRDYNNHCLIKGGRYIDLGNALSVDENYGMTANGFPYVWLVNSGSGLRVRGEVYQVDDTTLIRCDRLEGHPYGYRREPHQFRLANGNAITAYIYIFWRKNGQPNPRHTPYLIEGALQWDRGIVAPKRRPVPFDERLFVDQIKAMNDAEVGRLIKDYFTSERRFFDRWTKSKSNSLRRDMTGIRRFLRDLFQHVQFNKNK